MSVIPQNHIGGYKDKAGKVPLELLPPDALMEIGRVFARGAVKYSPRNVELGLPWGDLLGSAKRHMAKFEMGEDIDIDTHVDDGGVLHIAAAAWALIMLTAFQKRPHMKKFDNRSQYIHPELYERETTNIPTESTQTPQSSEDDASEAYSTQLRRDMAALLSPDGFRVLDTMKLYPPERVERVDNIIKTLRAVGRKLCKEPTSRVGQVIITAFADVLEHSYSIPRKMTMDHFGVGMTLVGNVDDFCGNDLRHSYEFVDRLCCSIRSWLLTAYDWEETQDSVESANCDDTPADECDGKYKGRETTYTTKVSRMIYDAGFSLRSFAQHIGRSISKVWYATTGTKKASHPMRMLIAQTLNVNPDVLFDQRGYARMLRTDIHPSTRRSRIAIPPTRSQTLIPSKQPDVSAQPVVQLQSTRANQTIVQLHRLLTMLENARDARDASEFDNTLHQMNVAISQYQDRI